MEPRNAPFFYTEDRISRLSDTLIHHIFSFLDMKYVVQTGVLSRRWRYIWASLPTLNFNSNIFYSPKTNQVDGFLDFIDRVFVLRNSSDIQRFHLVYHDKNCDETIARSLNSWILAAVRRNVQELIVDIDVNLHFEVKLPLCLFTCRSLTKFELEMSRDACSDVVLPNSISLPCLRSLKLTSLSMNDTTLTDKLFSSCPILDSLIITNNRMNFNISSLSLEHFEIRHLKLVDEEVEIVKLNAPNLTSFSCKCYLSHDYSLENLCSLVTADIETVEDDDEEAAALSEHPAEVRHLFAQNMMKLLRALSRVKDLTLSRRFLEAISGYPNLLEIQHPQFLNLRSLKLGTWLSKDCFPAITYLVKISPNIESLSLVITKIKFSSANNGDYWEAGWLLPCMQYHLKFIEIQGVVGCVNELKFLEILLKNALVLERVLLFSSLQGPGDMEEQLIKFMETLRTFPKASPRVVILFSKS